MRDTYFFLLVYVFVVVGGTLFFIIPAVFLVLGFLFGFLGSYYDFGTLLADIFILVGTFPWKYWFVFLPLTLLIAIGFLMFTRYARKTVTFRKFRIKK